MNRISALSAFALIMFTTAVCQADSLVITYRSGKTQTVVLDEPSVGINSWQFVGGTAPQQQSKKMDEAVAPPAQEQVQKEQQKYDKRLTEKAPDKKPSIRVKMNAKPIPD
ncbi:MAG: hypothetical protein HGB32_01835 [Geobacteraceae bacterium]|nr:hypothetical protein [Geobacteraceae bacterium]NTW78873.1 hypothetical protein [Geobacteraceae bacterium]